MTIRVEETTDIDRLVPLNQPVQDEHQERRPDWFKPFDAAAVHAALSDELSRAEARALIVTVDGVPAGYLLLIARTRSETAIRHADRTLEIDQMSVNPEHRRLGLGKALVDRALEIARSESFDRVRLTVWSDNEAAKAFYKAVGFTTYRESMEIEI